MTAVVLARDEEPYIERCLRHLDFVDETIVVDSGSVDRTRELAAAAGARVVPTEWHGWSHARNLGADAATNDWILALDADEVVTAQLARSIRAALAAPMDPLNGYSVDRRDDFLGRLMPSGVRPETRRTWVRLYHRGHSRWNPERVVHENVLYPGDAIMLDGLLLHWRGTPMDELAAGANRYATIEAAALDERGVRATLLRILLKPVLRFGWHYVVRRAFLYGAPGLIFSMTRAYNEFLQQAKLWERQNVAERRPDPPPELTEK